MAGADLFYDLIIIGGGVNGCGIARDAAGRGASVLLLEQNDLASGTSSASTKLVHGGLRYLEHYKFALVREALVEREVLWRIAPHIVRPLRFVLPQQKGGRPAWMLRAGLFLYDWLAPRALLKRSASVNLRADPVGEPLQPHLKSGFFYSDCAIDDARLTVLNAVDAAEHGAEIRTRTRFDRALRKGDRWQVTARDLTGAQFQFEGRALVNAAGPWVAQVLGRVGTASRSKVRLVQGSHIVARRKFEHDHAYLFQNADGRIVFAIPYERDFTLIGTTDRDYSGDPSKVSATEEEQAYLCAAASEYFAEPVRTEDIVWAYSGVRPLYDDGASEAKEATREYVLELDSAGPPLLSVFGGKITTYRKLAEAALSRLAPLLGVVGGRTWTGEQPLPGGDFPMQGKDALTAQLYDQYPALPPSLLARLATAYGTRARLVLGSAQTATDLGRSFGADLHEAEIRYLHDVEWARTAEDIVWRRSKLGLSLSNTQLRELDAYVGGLANGLEDGDLETMRA